jgi:hypothetical protein
VRGPVLAAVTLALLALVGLAGCPPRATDAPPVTGGGQATEPGPASAPAPASAPRADRPAGDQPELAAVPPFVDHADASSRAWLDGFRATLRSAAPGFKACWDKGEAEAVPCACRVVCGLRFARLPGGAEVTEITYPPIPGAETSLRGFRVKATGVVESCSFRRGAPEAEGGGAGGGQTTEIVWCEAAGGAK